MKGFKVKKTSLLQPIVRRYLTQEDGRRLEDLMQQNNEPEKVVHRKLMDAYGNVLSSFPIITFKKKTQKSSTRKFCNDFLEL